MLVDVPVDLVEALLLTAVRALDDPVDVPTAQAAVSALALMVEQWETNENDDEYEPELVPTKDPDTCGHPEAWQLNDDTMMCRSCGATKDEWGWVLL